MRIIYSNKTVSTTILTALLITGFIIIQPLHIHAQKEIATNIPDPIKVTKCQVVNPPTDPIDMNTVIFKDVAKTIHVEKEIFKCIIKNDTPVIAVVSLFTELFEKMKNQSTLNKKTVETVTCVKGYNGTVSYCDSKKIPISNEYPFAVDCDPLNLRTLNIMSLIEMETVVSSNGISKTVEAE